MKDALISALAEGAPRYGFYELVRLLEYALGARVDELDPAATEDRIVFDHAPDLGFPVSDVAAVRIEAGRARVETTFLGLLGTASPLTPEWTEQILHEDDEGALRRFYDVFHHRALALLFAAWKAHALEGGFDLRGDDAVSMRLRSLAGIDAWAEDGAEPLRPMASLGLGDHRRGQPHTIDLPSAEALLRRLYPDWNVRLEAAVERVVPLSPAERTRLGVERHRLGRDVVYGTGAAEAEGLLRLRLGPVDAPTYESLMPGGEAYARLERVVCQVFAGAVDAEIEVEVAPRGAATCVLGRRTGSRLGVDARYSAERETPVRVRAPLLRDAWIARRAFV